MKVLFIGGTGIISSACAPLAISQGIELFLLNRGQSSRPTGPGLGRGAAGRQDEHRIFDNSKVKALVPGFACTVPFSQGAWEIVAHHLAHPAKIDEEVDQVHDRLIAKVGA
jgi:hypothetical protein